MDTTVAVVGVGRMGTPICGHVVRGGYRVLAFDPAATNRATVEAAGATWAASLAEVGDAADVALVCVGFEAEADALLTGESGLLSTLRPGSVVAVLSTVSPGAVQGWASTAALRRVHVVDAAVCRGSWAADEGTLLSFVGGPDEAFAAVHDVARCYSSDVVHAGPVGAGQVCKAVNNMILWACLVADHEGLALARRYGVDTEALRRALVTSTAGNKPLEDWGRATMAWAQDDMAIVTAMADECGISLPQAGVTREICRTLKPRRFDLEAYGA